MCRQGHANLVCLPREKHTTAADRSALSRSLSNRSRECANRQTIPTIARAHSFNGWCSCHAGQDAAFGLRSGTNLAVAEMYPARKLDCSKISAKVQTYAEP